jgi:hypothetical protein
MMILKIIKMGCIVFDMSVMLLNWPKFVDVTPIDILACHIMCLKVGYTLPSIMCQLIVILQNFLVWIVLFAFHPLHLSPTVGDAGSVPSSPKFAILSLKVYMLYIFLVIIIHTISFKGLGGEVYNL